MKLAWLWEVMMMLKNAICSIQILVLVL